MEEAEGRRPVGFEGGSWGDDSVWGCVGVTRPAAAVEEGRRSLARSGRVGSVDGEAEASEALDPPSPCPCCS